MKTGVGERQEFVISLFASIDIQSPCLGIPEVIRSRDAPAPRKMGAPARNFLRLPCPAPTQKCPSLTVAPPRPEDFAPALPRPTLCICTGSPFEVTFENSLWRKIIQMQPMWLCICPDIPFEETYENSLGRQIAQMQPMWLCVCLCKCLEDTCQKSLW